MELTPRARSLEGPVRDALLMVRKLFDTEVQFLPETAVRTFRIAMSDYCTATILPLMVQRLECEAPGISLIVDPWSQSSFANLDSGELDFSMTLRERQAVLSPRHPDLLREVSLFDDDFVCVVDKNHPLESRFEASDYSSFPHVVATFGDDTRTIDQATLEGLGIETKVRFAVPSFSALLLQLPGSKAIGIVPKRLAQFYIPVLGLRMLEPPVRFPQLNETLIWHMRNDSDAAHGWVRGLVADIGGVMCTERDLSAEGSVLTE